MTTHKRVIRALRNLAEDLEAGVPIEATEVRRVETPDGPMHVRRPVVIDGKAAKSQGRTPKRKPPK